MKYCNALAPLKLPYLRHILDSILFLSKTAFGLNDFAPYLLTILLMHLLNSLKTGKAHLIALMLSHILKMFHFLDFISKRRNAL